MQKPNTQPKANAATTAVAPNPTVNVTAPKAVKLAVLTEQQTSAVKGAGFNVTPSVQASFARPAYGKNIASIGPYFAAMPATGNTHKLGKAPLKGGVAIAMYAIAKGIATAQGQFNGQQFASACMANTAWQVKNSPHIQNGKILSGAWVRGYFVSTMLKAGYFTQG